MTNDFKISGDRTTGDVIVECKACGEQFDGKYSETLAWRRWHRSTCTGRRDQAETG